MSKNALLICANRGFQPGVNAMINALDYYESDIDLHVILDKELPAEYIDRLQPRNNDLNYNLIIHTLEEVSGPMEKMFPNYYQNEFQRWAYFRYFYIYHYLAPDYDAVGMLDGDQIIVGDLTKWFNMTAQTDFMFTGYHAFHTIQLEEYGYSVMSKYVQGEGYKYRLEPLFNQPMICNPKKYCSFFKDVVKRMYDTHEQDMDCFNKILYHNKLFPRVIPLSPDGWIGNCVWHNRIQKKNVQGKDIFFTLPGHEKIYTIHGKWYLPGFCQSQYRTHRGDKKIIEDNIDEVFNFYLKMNRGHKINLPLVSTRCNPWDMAKKWRADNASLPGV